MDKQKLNKKIESQNFFSLELEVCQHTNVVHTTKYTMYAGKSKKKIETLHRRVSKSMSI